MYCILLLLKSFSVARCQVWVRFGLRCKRLDIVKLLWCACSVSHRRTYSAPRYWQTWMVKIIFKKANRIVCFSDRGITLFSLLRKTYKFMLQCRWNLMPGADKFSFLLQGSLRVHGCDLWIWKIHYHVPVGQNCRNVAYWGCCSEPSGSQGAAEGRSMSSLGASKRFAMEWEAARWKLVFDPSVRIKIFGILFVLS